MEITKYQKLVASFASKSTIRPELACVKADGKDVMATDSFSMIEISNLSDSAIREDPMLIVAKQIEDIKLGKKAGVITIKDGKAIANGIMYPVDCTSNDPSGYPVVDSLWKKKEDAKIQININGMYLANAALALSKLDVFGKVTMYINPDDLHSPIFIESSGSEHSGRAAVMPCSR